MVKLTYADLNSDQLIGSLSRLSQEKLPVKVAWNIQRLMRQIEKEVKEGREIYMAILKDCCELDEQKNFVFQRQPDIQKEDGTIEPGLPIPGRYIVKDEEEFKNKTEEFMKLKVKLKSYPIKLKDLETLQFTAVDLMNLAPLISDLDEVK